MTEAEKLTRLQDGLGEVAKVAGTLSALAGAVMEPRNVDGAHFLTLPPNYSHKDITDLVEKAQPMRNRKSGTVCLGDVASLLAYCADQAAKEHGYIYADPDSRTITAVFNDQRGTVAGWRDHRAQFKAEYTPEFAKWLANDKRQMDQTTFAEFIEDNVADIPEPGAQLLLAVATTIQASTGISFSSQKRLQDGQTQLTYTETIEARATAASGAIQIPKDFALGLRIFKNGAGYKLTARLKFRLAGGAVKFWYELDRPERSVEDAFAGYVKTVCDESGYTVLIGAAGQ